MTIFFQTKGRLSLISGLAGCFIAFSNPVQAADPATATPRSLSSLSDARTGGDRSAGVDTRTKRLHDLLKISPDQEAQWRSVAQVMRDNASAIDGAVAARVQKAQTMNAIDDLSSYQAIVAAHAEGLRKLETAFAPLYSSMPRRQQRTADEVFGHRTAPSRLRAHA